MTAPAPFRPLAVRAINATGAALRRVGINPLRQSSEQFVKAAIKKAGCDDFGETEFLEGLRVFVDAIDTEAQLNTIGQITLRSMIGGGLEQRLRLHAHRLAHPEVAEERVERPIFVVGLPRTGTTILFNLLAQDLRHRSPLGWEVNFPNPPPETATYETDPRIAEMEKIFADLERMIPGLAAIHEFGSQLPQECPPILAQAMLSMQFHVLFKVPSYQAWLDEQSLQPGYAYHRQFLQHLQSRHRRDRWVLKSPAHLPFLGDLLAEYPDALVIHTHRDPVRVIPSAASLYWAFRGMNSDVVDPRETGRDVLEVWGRAVQAAVDARAHLNPDQFFDAHFADVVTDPVDLLRRAYEHFGLEFTDQTRTRMGAFLAQNPRGSRGAHRYRAEDFALDPEEIADRFRPYCEAFDVPIGTGPA